MADINRSDLFEKLNPHCMATLQGAVAFCKLRGNPYVELAHWFHQLLQHADNDLQRIIRHVGIDQAALSADMVRALDTLPRGAGSISDLSVHIDHAVEQAWLYASIAYDDRRIRSAHLLLGLLKAPAGQQTLLALSAEWKKVVPDVLLQDLPDMVRGSPEQAVESTEPAAADGQAASGDAAKGLRRYGVDLTAKARAGELDPVSGREDEIRQMVDVLLRRRQNNPLMVGEAGVGKTAVVEGLALRLAAAEVPPALHNVALWLLDLGALQAGAGVKGEFEARLRQVIDDVQSSPVPIILFIDEIHTLIGAGGAQGTSDAANLLKPMLARGQLRTIGATTWSEYKRHIERDQALTRRFQAIQVEEPDEDKAIIMLRGIAERLAAHHGVLLLDEAIEAAVRFSHRYIPARQLPDKAIALLDTACARTAVSQHAPPAQVEDARRQIEYLDIAREIAVREWRIDQADLDDVQDIDRRMDDVRVRREGLELRWQREAALVDELCQIRQSLMQNDAPQDDAPQDAGRTRLADVMQSLADLQAEQPLVFAAVDAQVVAEVVADWTGVPVGRVMLDEARTVLELDGILQRRVLGQSHALQAIAHRIQIARAKLEDPNKPLGVFMLCGPSGTGKTETALALAEALYGGEQNLITINMSEFQEAHTVSTLKGAPPGYVGYGEGGVLTEAVRRRPHSVVLLDEIEKAHPDVHEIFFQVFDKGWMEDGEGRHIDFRNTLILLTSNVGSEHVMHACGDPQQLPAPDDLADVLRGPLLRAFPAALLGRLTVVPYYPLSDALLVEIASLRIARVAERLQAHHGLSLAFDASAYALLLQRCAQWESGARMIDAILNAQVLPEISRRLLGRALAYSDPWQCVRISAADGAFTHAFETRDSAIPA